MNIQQIYRSLIGVKLKPVRYWYQMDSDEGKYYHCLLYLNENHGLSINRMRCMNRRQKHKLVNNLKLIGY